MKYLVFILYLLVLSSCLEIDPQDKKASRRLSYSTNVVHEDPKYPNQPHASSSINFKFNTNSAESQEVSSNTGSTYHKTRLAQPAYTTPRSTTYLQQQQDYSQDEYNFKYSPPPSMQSYFGNNHQQDLYKTTPNTNPYHPQTQSFNVGYSMSFTNKDAVTALKQVPSFDTGEIITGSRMEEVGRPNNGMQNSNAGASFLGDEFIRNSLIDSKKQKISGIKSKYPQTSKLNVNTKQLLAQANLSPKTQKQLAYLETAKNLGVKFTQNTSKDQKKNSPWQNLSPTVEIYHSKELSPSVYNQEVRSFDHSRALGKSEGFDVSNAVKMDYSSARSGASAYFKPDLNLNAFGADKTSNQYASYKKAASLPKLPIDTSLLRDPFLTTQQLTASPGSKTIPIHFDTTLIQEMNKHIVDSNTSPSFADTSLDTGASSNTGQLSYSLQRYPALNSAYSSPSSSSYYQTPSPLKQMKYGFKPPANSADIANPVTAQQFGFEAHKQIFGGPNNNPNLRKQQQQKQLFDSGTVQLDAQKYSQVPVKQTSYGTYYSPSGKNSYTGKDVATFNSDYGASALKTGGDYDSFRGSSSDYYNVPAQKTLPETSFSISTAQQSPPEAFHFDNYLKNYQNLQHSLGESPAMPDAVKEPNKFNEYINSKDYDFQKEFDKILYSSNIKPTENHQSGQQTQTAVQYKGPSYSSAPDQFGSNYNVEFNRFSHQKNGPKQVSSSSSHSNRETSNSNPQQNHKKRENHHQHKNPNNPRQSRLNLKTRVVREYIETDLKPPPMHANKDRHNRRVQAVQLHV